MAMNLTYKILKAHLREGELAKGRQIGIKIDQTLTQDATGTLAYLQFEAMGLEKVRTQLSVSYVDHNTLGDGFENADDHRYLQSVAAKYGIYFSRAGNGICHQVHLERFGAPGKTLLGSDSHTPTAGALGMLAIGAGGLDVACSLAGGLFYLTAPSVVRVELNGRLRPGVAAKDVILYVLSKLSTRGNVNKVLEYRGPGVISLSVPERATITNMGAETGVTSSLFASDAATAVFLKAQGRFKSFKKLEADQGAVYDEALDIDLTRLVPMAAAPHSPGNVVKVKDIAGLKVDQVAIGSCTNSSFKDLMTVARMLKGKKVHPQVSLVIAPGSRQVLSMIAANGALKDMIDAGARILEATCGFCIGNGQSPATESVSLRTSNRNFECRSGTASANVYLVSPETAAAAAITGKIVDPAAMTSKNYPRFKLPERFVLDDSMIVRPPKQRQAIQIARGPNIGQPPKGEKLSNSLGGRVLLKAGDKVTTDAITPAGTRLKYRSNIAKYAEFVFEGLDRDFSKKALEAKAKGEAVFVVAGLSYGQGSSREHAAMCPMYLGVRVVIAKSFERIHAANLVNFGILPLTFSDENDYQKINNQDELSIEGIFETLDKDGPISLFNKTANVGIKLTYSLTSREKNILKAGGLLNYVAAK